MGKFSFLVLALAATLSFGLATDARADSGTVLRIEHFKSPATGMEFLFVWGSDRIFCITEPAASVEVIIQPDALPQEFRWGRGGIVTLKIHRSQYAKTAHKVDIAELCD